MNEIAASHRQRRPRSRLAITLIAALLASLVMPARPAAAQTTITETIVGQNSRHVWKALTTGVEQGTAWREVGFDDSTWTDLPVKHYTRRAIGNGSYMYYAREEFDITDIHQITELHLDLYYDDTAVLYLNGTEVYRSIRNNLPDTDEVAVSAVMPVNTRITYGGLEDYYVQIPADSNRCQLHCTDTSTDPVDLSLLNEGLNSFAVMFTTRPNSDIGFDLGIAVDRDLDAPLPDNVVLSEVVTTNDSVLDEDGDTPDWFELHNIGSIDVNLAGWTVADSTVTWTFPAVTLPVDGRLRVFASDKDRSPTDGSNLHTDFKLSKEADSLSLTDPNSIVRTDWTNMPRGISDVSWGRVNDTDTIGYLASTTPGAANSGAASALAPIVRPFSSRVFNLGDSATLQVDAFDPEGTTLSYGLSGGSELSIDGATGAITGTLATAGETEYTLTVQDQSGLSTSQAFTVTTVEAPTPSTPLVMNEYNAVAPTKELGAGSDVTLGQVVGNGGDWYEFVVVDDLLDLRGWTLQFWDRDRDDELLDRAASLTFSDDFALAALPAGTIITISEDRVDDLSFDPDNGDWTINLQANTDTPGAMFSVQENFNSTRDSQHVEIRNADGVLMSPLVGETEAWDDAAGGVNGGEVMNLCIDPAVGDLISAVNDYADNSTTSTYGLPNKCEYADPADDTGATIITFDQDFTTLRSEAGLRGDADCDGDVDIGDALAIAQFAAGNRIAVSECPLPSPQTHVNISNGDFNVADAMTMSDALFIAKCQAGIGPAELCGS